MTLPLTARSADRDQGQSWDADVPASADDSTVTRFSYLPVDGETPLILTSAFGRYRVSLPGDHTPRRVTSRIAFFCQPVPSVEQSGEFWACRTTYAVDSKSGQPHRLIWGLNEKGALVTFARPEVKQPSPDASGSTVLIPVDAATFGRISAAVAECQTNRRSDNPSDTSRANLTKSTHSRLPSSPIPATERFG